MFDPLAGSCYGLAVDRRCSGGRRSLPEAGSCATDAEAGLESQGVALRREPLHSRPEQPTAAQSRARHLIIDVRSRGLRARRSAVAAVAALSGAATFGIASAYASPPASPVSPASLDFGQVPEGMVSASQTVTFTNIYPYAVKLYSIGLAGTDKSDFNYSTTCTFNAPLPSGQSCTATVSFAPPANDLETNTANLTFYFGRGEHSASVGLSGTGIRDSVIPVFNPPGLDFGTVSDITTAQLPLTVTNDGNATLVITDVEVPQNYGTDPGNFSVDQGCVTSLAPGASCTTNVTYTPEAAELDTAEIKFTDHPIGDPWHVKHQFVQIEGTGVSPALVTASPNPVNFGGVVVGRRSYPNSITVTNESPAGGAVATFGTPQITGTDSDDFAIVNDGCTELAPGQSCTIVMVASPANDGDATSDDVGQLTATLVLPDTTQSGETTVTLEATGVVPPGGFHGPAANDPAPVGGNGASTSAGPPSGPVHPGR